MTKPAYILSILRSSLQITRFALALICALSMIAMQPAQAQTFSVIYNFTPYGQQQPATGLTIDAHENFYGTTLYTDSSHTDGGVFKLRQSGANWIFTPLYGFPNGVGNYDPEGPLLLAADGNLFGNLATSWDSHYCGGVFHLAPSGSIPRTALAQWNYTSIYTFSCGSDGANPTGPLTFDQSGDIYGTTNRGGSAGFGTTYELTRSDNNWTETVLHSAQGDGDGVLPVNGVVLDTSGNLYGVFAGAGPYGQGAIYELSPSGSGWTEQILYGFTGGSDGEAPSSVIIDASGDLFGTTSAGGSGNGGTIFELARVNGGWNFSTLYSLSGTRGDCGPDARLILDTAGNLYGETKCDGAYGLGSVFKLTHSAGGWTYSDLHDFTGGSDGEYPQGSLVFDTNGNLYGTTFGGGAYGGGVVFQITP